MAGRAIWKGVIGFGSVRVPVKLYSAVQDRGVHFRLLHGRDRVPLRQRMVNPLTGAPVPAEQVRRGYEVEEGVFVILGEDELAALEPPPSRDIEVTRFVDPALIDHQFYARPYYLGPDGDERAYFALAGAMRRRGVLGVARWVMRKKEYSGALGVSGEHLVLTTLRPAEEVVAVSAIEPPVGRAPDDKELALAEKLLAALEGNFDPAAYADEHRQRVRELIEARARGAALPRPRVERAPPERSLLDALQGSLATVREGGAPAH
jgi:DNA end-binding protein Ku